MVVLFKRVYKCVFGSWKLELCWKEQWMSIFFAVCAPSEIILWRIPIKNTLINPLGRFIRHQKEPYFSLLYPIMIISKGKFNVFLYSSISHTRSHSLALFRTNRFKLVPSIKTRVSFIWGIFMFQKSTIASA